MKKLLLAMSLAFVSISCSEDTEEMVEMNVEDLEPTDETSAAETEFNNNILPIIQNNCASCHTGGSQINFTVFENASSNIGAIITRTNLEPSDSNFMPRGGTKLSDEDLAKFTDWQTTLNNQ